MNSNEQQPLLAHEEHEDPQGPPLYSEKSIRRYLPQIYVTHPKFRFLPVIGCLIVLVNEGEYYFKQIGYFRAVEALYCIEYFNFIDPETAKLGRRIPEYMCKEDYIQKRVATANGIIMLVRMTSAFIGTVLLGYLADKVGRRLPLIMHKVGTVIYTLFVVATYIGYPTVPIWVSFLGGLGGIIGANFDLNIAVLLASYTDAMTSKAQIASYFFITNSMQYVGQITFPLAAGRAINLDGRGGTPQVALFISLGMAIAGLCISVFLFPETGKAGGATGAQPSDHHEPNDEEDAPKQKGFSSSIRAKIRSFWEAFQHSVRGVGTTNLLLLATSIFLSTTAIKCIDWLGLIQYPVIKFGWTYNMSTWALAIQAAVYIFTYFVLLPTYHSLGRRLHITPASTSLLIMMLSVLLLEAGAISLGLSSTAAAFIAATCIYTLGAGLPAVMQAYIASLVDKAGLGKLMAFISLFQVVGKICASALGPVVINAGIDSANEQLKGSVFFFAAVVFVLSAAALGAVALRTGLVKRAAGEGERGEGSSS